MRIFVFIYIFFLGVSLVFLDVFVRIFFVVVMVCFIWSIEGNMRGVSKWYILNIDSC